MYYPEEMITDQPERLIVAELIREKALELTEEEVPMPLPWKLLPVAPGWERPHRYSCQYLCGAQFAKGHCDR